MNNQTEVNSNCFEGHENEAEILAFASELAEIYAPLVVELTKQGYTEEQIKTATGHHLLICFRISRKRNDIRELQGL
jgi:hypothetical protein